MNRRNMKVNDWEELAAWLSFEGLDCYAELIWGAPGETVESFMKGYDRLSQHVSRVAVYPMLILPNTTYHQDKKRFGMVTVRGNTDDFEHLISHDTMSPSDNQYMHRFIFVSRLVAENPVFRHMWTPLRVLGGISQSAAIRSLMDWFAQNDDQACEPFRAGMINSFTDSDVLAPVLVHVYGTDEAKDLLRRWWRTSLRPLVPPRHRDVLDTVVDYDLLTLPAYTAPVRAPSRRYASEYLPVVDVDGEPYHVLRDVRLACDVPAIVRALRRGEPYEPAVRPVTADLYYKAGADQFLPSTNHEEVLYYMAKTERQARRQRDRSIPQTRSPSDVRSGERGSPVG